MENDWVVYKLKLYKGYIYFTIKKDQYLFLEKHVLGNNRTLIKDKVSKDEAERLRQICNKLTRN